MLSIPRKVEQSAILYKLFKEIKHTEQVIPVDGEKSPFPLVTSSRVSVEEI